MHSGTAQESIGTLPLREAVERLHRPTRLWLDICRELKLLARDPTSRLAAVRDVTLYLLPDYLPDPRVGAAALAELRSTETANMIEFMARYREPSARINGDKFFADFNVAGLRHIVGATFHFGLKFVGGCVLIFVPHPSGVNTIHVFDMHTCQVYAVIPDAMFVSHGWILCDNPELYSAPYPVRFAPKSNADLMLPCGLEIHHDRIRGVYLLRGESTLPIKWIDPGRCYDDYFDLCPDSHPWSGDNPSRPRYAFTCPSS